MAISMHFIESLSGLLAADYMFAMPSSYDMSIIGVDMAKGNDMTVTEPTDLGRWLIKSIQTMTGRTVQRIAFETQDSLSVVMRDGPSFVIGREYIQDSDPVKLLDYLTCAACGRGCFQVYETHRWRICSWDGVVRALCRDCGLTNPEVIVHKIQERNQRIGIPDALFWQRGEHGIRLDGKPMNRAIIPVTNDEVTKLVSAMRDAADLHVDKQVAAALMGLPTAEPAPNTAHEFRVGDRVRVLLECPRKGAVAKLLVRQTSGKWSVNVEGWGEGYDGTW
jgi:hypothetical protein